MRILMKKLHFLVASLICVSCTLYAQASLQQSKSQVSKFSIDRTIKIGVNVVASDPDDLPQLRSARMAVEEINAQGGVLGHKLELAVSYTQSRDVSQVHPALQKLVSQGANCILMTNGSAMVMKGAEFTIPRNLLLFASSASSPHITNLVDKGLVWRTIPSDVYQGKIAASLFAGAKQKTAGIMYLNNIYGNELSRAFRNEFEKKGGKVVASVRYVDTTTYATYNFDAQLEVLFKNKPDIIYLVSYVEDGVKIIKDAQRLGFLGKDYKPQLLGCDGNYNSDFILGVDAELIEGMLGLAYIHPKNSNSYSKFAANFKSFSARYQDSVEVANASLASLLDVESTNTFAAASYDAIYALAFAMQKANSAQPVQIAPALRRVSGGVKNAQVIGVGEYAKGIELLKAGKDINYDGASGNLEFDENGDVTTGNYIVWKVSNGRFTELKTVAFP
jgi:ABC-type branched-subunit amino acid transport system substrate-binding protein